MPDIGSGRGAASPYNPGMIPWLRADDPFPAVERALAEPNGLLAAGADLAPARLIDAYRHGIFPWYNEGQPVLWWSPDPRMVLFPGELKLSRSLRKRIARRDYVIEADSDFNAVMRSCAAPRPGREGTWITRDMIRAYGGLHRAGHAHCVETWIDGKLAGGLYGVAIGRMFYGESMFSAAADASKVALVALVERLRLHGCPLIDCQVRTPLLAALGAREIPRGEFLRRLSALVHYAEPAQRWETEDAGTGIAPRRRAGSVKQ